VGIDYDAAGLWLQAAGLGLSALNSICLVVLWFANRGRVTREAIDTVARDAESRGDELDKRLVRMEEAIRHAPTHEDLGKIYERLNSIGNHLAELRGGNEKISEQVTMLVNYLTQQGLRK
jgi:predicted ArsR family transcriptional regulator